MCSSRKSRRDGARKVHRFDVVRLLVALLVAACLPATAHASISSVTPIDSDAADFGGVAMAPDGSGGIVYRKRVDGHLHVFAAQFDSSGGWRAPQRVDNGQSQAAFLLNPTPIDRVWGAAHRGVAMPQKSTYFYPKLLTGLVFHLLDGSGGADTTARCDRTR